MRKEEKGNLNLGMGYQGKDEQSSSNQSNKPAKNMVNYVAW